MRWQCRLDLSDLVWLVGELVLLSVRCRVKHRVENAHEKSPTKAACSQVEYRCRQRCDVKCKMWVYVGGIVFLLRMDLYQSNIVYICIYVYSDICVVLLFAISFINCELLSDLLC